VHKEAQVSKELEDQVEDKVRKELKEDLLLPSKVLKEHKVLEVQ
jgi:hypothetical protein